MLSAICFTTRTGWARVADLSRISDLLDDPGCLLWATAEADSLSETDIATIVEEFKLHPLAVEDALSERQRPKFETYPTHRFLVAHQVGDVDGRLTAHQVACFLGDRYVLVIHRHAERALAEARARLQRPTAPEGALIIHALLDAIVDEYEATAESLETQAERIEEAVLGNPRAQVETELFAIKSRLAVLRRYAVPTERLLAQISEGSSALGLRAPEAFRDVHDHTQRIADSLRGVADLTDAVLDLQRGEQTRHLSDVTKRLSGWAAIIAAPTLIASMYGMNFALVPQEGTMTGFVVAVSTMVVSGGVLWGVMRRRGWV